MIKMVVAQRFRYGVNGRGESGRVDVLAFLHVRSDGGRYERWGHHYGVRGLSIWQGGNGGHRHESCVLDYCRPRIDRVSYGRIDTIDERPIHTQSMGEVLARIVA